MGSPRVKGNSNVMCSYFEQLLDNNNIPYDTCRVGLEKELKPCFHCRWCANTKHCFQKDMLYPFIRDFNDYDTIVIFTPIYFFQFSGQTKICIDRLGASSWKDKNIYLVSSSGSDDRMGGNDLLVESLVRTSEFNECYFKGYYNKVTNDLMLPIDDNDINALNGIVESIIESKVKSNEVKED